MSIEAIAVFCGSKLGNNPLFEEHTRMLGEILAEKHIKIIYGGGNKGLMGAVANAALDSKGSVIGIIPTLLKEQEHLHETLTETHVVGTMHERKKMLTHHSTMGRANSLGTSTVLLPQNLATGVTRPPVGGPIRREP